MKIKQESKYLNNDWWQWSVELDGPPDELDRVEYVVYTLHPTFPQPVRRVQDRQTNFKLEANGWGEFPIYASVVFNDGTEEDLEHELQLYYPSGERTTK